MEKTTPTPRASDPDIGMSIPEQTERTALLVDRLERAGIGLCSASNTSIHVFQWDALPRAIELCNGDVPTYTDADYFGEPTLHAYSNLGFGLSLTACTTKAGPRRVDDRAKARACDAIAAELNRPRSWDADTFDAIVRTLRDAGIYVDGALPTKSKLYIGGDGSDK